MRRAPDRGVLTLWLHALAAAHETVLDVGSASNHCVVADHATLNVTPGGREQSGMSVISMTIQQICLIKSKEKIIIL